VKRKEGKEERKKEERKKGRKEERKKESEEEGLTNHGPLEKRILTLRSP
jgi:hypothetical protein